MPVTAGKKIFAHRGWCDKVVWATCESVGGGYHGSTTLHKRIFCPLRPLQCINVEVFEHLHLCWGSMYLGHSKTFLLILQSLLKSDVEYECTFSPYQCYTLWHVGIFPSNNIISVPHVLTPFKNKKYFLYICVPNMRPVRISFSVIFS